MAPKRKLEPAVQRQQKKQRIEKDESNSRVLRSRSKIAEPIVAVHQTEAKIGQNLRAKTGAETTEPTFVGNSRSNTGQSDELVGKESSRLLRSRSKIIAPIATISKTEAEQITVRRNLQGKVKAKAIEPTIVSRHLRSSTAHTDNSNAVGGGKASEKTEKTIDKEEAKSTKKPQKVHVIDIEIDVDDSIDQCIVNVKDKHGKRFTTII